MKTLIAVLGTIGLLGASAASVSAQEALSTEPFNLDEITCFDVVSLPEADADFVTALLIGYKAGMAGETALTPKSIEETVLDFDKNCLDKPDMKAIEAL